MRAYVFTDKALASEAGRFVWLAIDSEKAQNGPFKAQFSFTALPSFFVIDPATEKLVLRWVGGLTVAQIRGVLDDGEALVRGTTGKDAADVALKQADALYGEGKYPEAAAAYRTAIAAAPAGWTHYARAVESALFALSSSKEYETAAMLAREAYPKVGRGVSMASIAASGLDCALQLPPEHAHRKEWVEAFEADSRSAVTGLALEIAADDISGVYQTLISARDDAKDSTGVHDYTVQWAAFLDGAAARAANPDARAVFDSHRLGACLDLGTPERAIPMLQASERDLPDDYNPPARLATIYKVMHQWDDALAASDRALTKAYGPRRLGILQTRSDIYKGRGDLDKARKTLDDAVHEAEALPPGQRNDATIAALKKKRDALAVQ